MFIEIQNSVCGRDNEFRIRQAAFMFSANESFFHITFLFFYKPEYNKKNGSGCNFHFKQTKFHQETFLSCLVQQIFFFLQ